MSTVVELLTKVMGDVGAVRKGDRNETQGFNFRGVDAVVNAVSPALRKHGVVVTPDVRSIERATVEVGRNRTPMGHVTVVVAYTFTAPDGSSIVTSAAGEAMDSGDKATPKAMSVAYRTALLQALCLPTDEPDPDAETYHRTDVSALKAAKSRMWATWQRVRGNADGEQCAADFLLAIGKPLDRADTEDLDQFSDLLSKEAVK